jgi:hypothetical protein
MNAESKVTAEHLKRAAYLYIRQSTLRQVLENTESTERQYALRRRAVALGWSDEQVVVIDHDQGLSGASTNEREGFQRLVADVGLGRAGIVMGLEVSRLARNCADWHRLLEICALTHTLILDKCEAIKNVKQPMEKPVESAHVGFSTSHFSEGMEWSFLLTNERKTPCLFNFVRKRMNLIDHFQFLGQLSMS